MEIILKCQEKNNARTRESFKVVAKQKRKQKKRNRKEERERLREKYR